MNKKYLAISICVHAVVFLALALGFDFTAPLPVIENTNQHDVISAVVLGDTEKSKLLPREVTPTPPPPKQVAQETPPKPETPTQPLFDAAQMQKDIIALKKVAKKKLANQKALEAKKQHDLFAKDLLADLKKTNEKQKTIKQKQLQAQFQKTLHEQSEKSLRQQLLNEEIKLQGTETRQSQGEVNKYKALIIQAISEHWLIPPQANKTLYCELMIRLAPAGMVLDVQITKSSGDPALDSSARAAVLKASPLPVPSDPKEFDAFRQFVLKVKPENVLASSG